MVLVARNQARADATTAMIEAVAPGTRVDVYFGDFRDLASVAALGREIVEHHPRIDTLINNASGAGSLTSVKFRSPCGFTTKPLLNALSDLSKTGKT